MIIDQRGRSVPWVFSIQNWWTMLCCRTAGSQEDGTLAVWIVAGWSLSIRRGRKERTAMFWAFWLFTCWQVAPLQCNRRFHSPPACFFGQGDAPVAFQTSPKCLLCTVRGAFDMMPSTLQRKVWRLSTISLPVILHWNRWQLPLPVS